jgi:hypothetical protein
MLLATVVCSDPQCFEERELAVETLDEVDRDICECGHGFVVVTVARLEESGRAAPVVSLRRPQRGEARRAA